MVSEARCNLHGVVREIDMVCAEAAWSEGVSLAGVREVFPAEGETQDPPPHPRPGCGKKLHKYEKQARRLAWLEGNEPG